MRTVVDACVAAKWYFEEPGREAADHLLQEQIAGGRELIAPDLIAAELANLLWKKIGRSECDAGAAEAILALWEVDRPQLVPSVLLAARALDLALALDHPVYDCLYLAAAVEYGATFATADRRLARAARTVLPEVELLR